MTSERALPVSGPVALTPASAAQSAAIKKMLIPLALGQFLAAYANSALNVSISDIAANLGTTVTGVQTAIETGLLLTPATIGVLIASWRVGTMVTKYAVRSIIAVGFGLAAVGVVLLVAGAMLTTNDWWMAPGLLIFGFGLGASLPASVNLVQSSMPEADQGEISGVSRSVSNLGSSLGTAVAGAVMVSVLITGVSTLTQQSQVLPPAAKDQISIALQGDVSILSNAQVSALLVGQPPEIVNEVVRINAEARDRALGLAELMIGLIAFFGFVVALRLPKEPRPSREVPGAQAA